MCRIYFVIFVHSFFLWACYCSGNDYSNWIIFCNFKRHSPMVKTSLNKESPRRFFLPQTFNTKFCYIWFLLSQNFRTIFLWRNESFFCHLRFHRDSLLCCCLPCHLLNLRTCVSCYESKLIGKSDITVKSWCISVVRVMYCL
jgi:hypothetical protein